LNRIWKAEFCVLVHSLQSEHCLSLEMQLSRLTLAVKLAVQLQLAVQSPFEVLLLLLLQF